MSGCRTLACRGGESTMTAEHFMKNVGQGFHMAKHRHDAVDRVRRTELRVLKQVNDTRLTGTKYLWLMRRTDRIGLISNRIRIRCRSHLESIGWIYLSDGSILWWCWAGTPRNLSATTLASKPRRPTDCSRWIRPCNAVPRFSRPRSSS